MRFPNQVCVVATLAAFACGELAVTPSEEGNLGNAPGASMRIVATVEPAGGAELDSVLVTIDGPETRSLNLPGDGSSYEGTVDNLTPGTYTVVSAGFAESEIVLLAYSEDEVVSDGDSLDVTLTLGSFVPAMRPLDGDSPSVLTSVDVEFSPVALATSYVVETDTIESFETGSGFTTLDTNATVLLSHPGSHFLRVRAQIDLVGAGAPSEITSVQIATDLTQSGYDASSASLINVEPSEVASLDGLNILPAGDEDWFAVDLSAGQVMDVVVWSQSMIPGSALTPSLELLGDADISAAEGVGSTEPASDVWQQKTAMEDGRYFIRVTGADGLSVGHYALEVSVESSESTVQGNLIEETFTSPVSGIHSRQRSVIDNSDEWQALWQQLWGSVAPLPATPEIDFDDKMVIVAAMGQQTTGGYSIEIESVIESDGRIVASVVETSPGMGCAVIQALTAPAAAVVVPRSDMEVTFEEQEVTRECT